MGEIIGVDEQAKRSWWITQDLGLAKLSEEERGNGANPPDDPMRTAAGETRLASQNLHLKWDRVTRTRNVTAPKATIEMT
jgi:hypothetical protein